MQTKEIRALIEEGKATERQTGMLRQSIINLVKANGRSVAELDVQSIVQFISDYIELAPALLERIEAAAGAAGLQDDVQPILDATEEYFLTTDDTIPDHLGLVGLLDDAYLTHTLMQAISDRYHSQSGRALMPPETQEDNACIRRLIGEPFVSILDDRVAATLGSPSLQQNFRQMLMTLGELSLFTEPGAVWENVQGSARSRPLSAVAAPADVRIGVLSVI